MNPPGPGLYEEEEIEVLEATAKRLHRDENLRSKGGAASYPDPASFNKTENIQEEDLKTLKRKFPFLSDFSDHFLKHTPLANIIKMESTRLKMGELERTRSVEDKLAANKMALESSLQRVNAGEDNRCSILHPARFLCGASTSAARVWIEARKVIGLNGFPPVGNYDMAAVGLTGVVTAKGWAELHNPASSRLSVRQFNINNCNMKSSTQDASDSDISDLGEFKLAVRALRTAMMLVHPWNMSVAALEGFLLQSNFCTVDLAGTEKKAQLLTQFCDYVLLQNSEKWRDGESFLSTADLKGTWAAFFAARPQSAGMRVQQKNSNTAKKLGSSRPAYTNDPSFVALGICFAYNEGRCLKQAGDCATRTGRKLKHVCNDVADPAKPTEVCGKEHIRVKFHK